MTGLQKYSGGDNLFRYRLHLEPKSDGWPAELFRGDHLIRYRLHLGAMSDGWPAV